MLTLTKNEAIDQITDALSDADDMDTPAWRYATRVVEYLMAQGVMFVREDENLGDRNETADPASGGESAVSIPSPPNDAERRREVAHDDIPTYAGLRRLFE